jgi:hypothetical protein
MFLSPSIRKIPSRRPHTAFEAPEHHFAIRNVKKFARIQKAWVLVIILIGKLLISAQYLFCTLGVKNFNCMRKAMTSSTAFVWLWMLSRFILVFVHSGIDAANEWEDDQQRKSDRNNRSSGNPFFVVEVNKY